MPLGLWRAPEDEEITDPGLLQAYTRPGLAELDVEIDEKTEKPLSMEPTPRRRMKKERRGELSGADTIGQAVSCRIGHTPLGTLDIDEAMAKSIVGDVEDRRQEAAGTSHAPLVGTILNEERAEGVETTAGGVDLPVEGLVTSAVVVLILGSAALAQPPFFSWRPQIICHSGRIVSCLHDDGLEHAER